MPSSSSLILVTGPNGYVGTHVLQQLLKNGYNVRAAVRSERAAKEMEQIHAAYAAQLKTTIVPDITVSGAFDEAVKDVDAVMHLATPYNTALENNEEEVLIPAIKGTESILKSVEAHGAAVKRVIITSSFAAIYDPTKGLNPGHVYTEEDWSPITYEIARDGDGFAAYFGAKLLAEKAAWDFLKKLPSPPKFDITVVNPSIVLGPSAKPLNFKALGTSMSDINQLIDGSLTEVPDPVPAFWPTVDVRDVATAHLRALENPEAGGHRILLASSMFSFQQLCDILRDSDRIAEGDKAKVPVGKPGQGYPGPQNYDFDVSKSKKLLGLQYRSLSDTVVDAALSLVQSRADQGL